MDQASKSPLGGTRTTARAFFVSDRLNTSGLERGDVLRVVSGVGQRDVRGLVAGIADHQGNAALRLRVGARRNHDDRAHDRRSYT